MAIKPASSRKPCLRQQAVATSSPAIFVSLSVAVIAPRASRPYCQCGKPNEIADILVNYIQPLFSQLPPELRLKIWKLNLPTTRVVPISCSVASPSLRDAPLCTTNQFFAGCTSDASVPVNLHVCAESRADALKHFQRAFGFARLPGHIYFNPASDILYFGPQDGYMAADAQFHTCLSMCDPSELASVRRIAISDALFWVGESYNSMTAASLTFEVFRQLSVRMPALQQIIFVPREQDEVSMPVLTEERMFQQIMMAIRTVCHRVPSSAAMSKRHAIMTAVGILSVFLYSERLAFIHFVFFLSRCLIERRFSRIDDMRKT
ncbi:hypothetical protein E4U60_003081 [Claviceps pazoutovae]|uniref:2EXR domain-containing protein n=1 Tax=Claviceps pazoutovae TaxID=1649127 RepID=A0A9P7MIA9_9HYPO|nr:hypothetical protein E4U60_003081 [Claviceps pazoutovae]